MAKTGNLEFDELYRICRSFFPRLKDPRSRNASIGLADYFLSAMVIFQLKYPSLLALDKRRTKAEDKNLFGVFSIGKIPSDTAMRETLDEISPNHYAHSMLAAVVVKPGVKTVLPMGCEPISRKDGSSKNDHELNAGKRLWAKLWERHKGLKILHSGDALYANGRIDVTPKNRTVNYC